MSINPLLKRKNIRAFSVRLTGQLFSNYFPITVVLLIALCSISVFFKPVNGDVAWYIYGAGRVLNGAALYKDIIDSNPPMIFLLNVPPVLFANIFKASPILCFNIYVLSLVLVTVLLCRKILSKIIYGITRTHLNLLTYTMVLLLITLVKNNFGQREHIYIILALPYILASIKPVSAVKNKIIRVFIGVAAGIGFALKPYFPVIWLLCMAYNFVNLRSIRKTAFAIENVTIALTLIIYSAGVFLLVHQYFDFLFSMVKDLYWAYGKIDILWVILNPTTIFAVLVLCLFLVTRPVSEYAKHRQLSITVMVGLLFIVFIQHKGYSYHYYPVQVFGCYVVILTLIGIVKQLKGLDLVLRPNMRAVNVFLLLLLVVALTGKAGMAIRSFVRPKKDYTSRLVTCISKIKDLESIDVLSMNPSPAFPLVNYTHAKLCSAYNCLWPLAGFYANVKGNPIVYRKKESMEARELLFFNLISNEIVSQSPTIIIVDERETSINRRPVTFDYLGYFSQNDGLKRKLMDYQVFEIIGPYKIYLLRNRIKDNPVQAEPQ